MNLENLKANKEQFFSLLKDAGYSAKTLRDLRGCYKVLMNYGGDESITSYEDFFTSVVLPKYSESGARDKKCCLGLFWYYEKYGVLPRPCCKRGFMKEDKYDKLCPEFKHITDNFFASKRKEHQNETAIKGRSYSLIKFLLQCQNAGYQHIMDIPEDFVRDYYASESLQTSEFSYTMRSALTSSKDEIAGCDAMMQYIPTIRPVKKPYDSLTQDESELMRAFIVSSGNAFSLRDKAIMTILFFLGLRRGDIAKLKMSDFDFEHSRLSFIQSKTLVRQVMPLRPVVGNTVLEYMTKERPHTNSDYLFLTACNPMDIRPITPWVVYDTAKKYFSKSGIRSESGRKGCHIFRHNVASSLIHSGCDSIEVTAVMGHVAPASLGYYLSADELLLKGCALSIDKYPVSNGLFIEGV